MRSVGLGCVESPTNSHNRGEPAIKTGRPRDAADLSASFRCVADNENVYVGVSVTDDILNFGEEPIGRPFFDDCVELLFYGDKTGISPLKIWVSADKSDRVTLDGREPVMNNPVIWQKHGVLATLSKTEKEYLIEVMIPNEVIGLTGWMKGAPVMMNVGVMMTTMGMIGCHIGKYKYKYQQMDEYYI